MSLLTTSPSNWRGIHGHMFMQGQHSVHVDVFCHPHQSPGVCLSAPGTHSTSPCGNSSSHIHQPGLGDALWIRDHTTKLQRTYKDQFLMSRGLLDLSGPRQNGEGKLKGTLQRRCKETHRGAQRLGCERKGWWLDSRCAATQLPHNKTAKRLQPFFF